MSIDRAWQWARTCDVVGYRTIFLVPDATFEALRLDETCDAKRFVLFHATTAHLKSVVCDDVVTTLNGVEHHVRYVWRTPRTRRSKVATDNSAFRCPASRATRASDAERQRVCDRCAVSQHLVQHTFDTGFFPRNTVVLRGIFRRVYTILVSLETPSVAIPIEELHGDGDEHTQTKVLRGCELQYRNLPNDGELKYVVGMYHKDTVFMHASLSACDVNRESDSVPM